MGIENYQKIDTQLQVCPPVSALFSVASPTRNPCKQLLMTWMNQNVGSASSGSTGEITECHFHPLFIKSIDNNLLNTSRSCHKLNFADVALSA